MNLFLKNSAITAIISLPVIFQADFAAGETKTFTLSVGSKQLYPKEEYKAFGRFTDAAAWTRHVGEFAQGLASPIEIQTTLLK